MSGSDSISAPPVSGTHVDNTASAVKDSAATAIHPPQGMLVPGIVCRPAADSTALEADLSGSDSISTLQHSAEGACTLSTSTFSPLSLASPRLDSPGPTSDPYSPDLAPPDPTSPALDSLDLTAAHALELLASELKTQTLPPKAVCGRCAEPLADDLGEEGSEVCIL